MARRPGESDSLRYGLEELKFLRSFEDLRILSAKVAYKRPRKLEALGASPWVPPSLQIEPTNVCNLRCTTCPGARSSFPKGHMDVGLFENIISEASEIGVKRIHLFLRGEPTLHPGIYEMIRFTKSKGLGVHLTTNGTRLTPEKSAELLDSGVDSADQLTISFIGHSKESHEATMVGVDHDLVIRNVIELLRLRKELGANGPVIETILNPTPETQHETQEFLRFWRGKVDHARIGGISIAFQEYKREGDAAVRRSSLCHYIFDRMPVLWNGQVPQCNMDFDGERMVGDLNKDSIMDTWNSEQMQTVRRIHLAGQFERLPLCLHCDM
ncbi:MAG TPA: radical SAM/SPASM domain-containing protein [Propionibacteriaceae bacterium]